MKRTTLFLSLALGSLFCSKIFSEENAYISSKRIYEEVLEVSAENFYLFSDNDYIKEVPVKLYGNITKTEALEKYREIAEKSTDPAVLCTYAQIAEKYRPYFPSLFTDDYILSYYQKAADMNFAPAWNAIGIFYENLCARKNTSSQEKDLCKYKASENFSKAMQKKYPHAFLNLAKLSYPADEKKKKENLKLFNEALASSLNMETISDEIKLSFSKELIKGEILKKDTKLAKKYLLELSEKENLEAMHIISSMQEIENSKKNEFKRKCMELEANDTKRKFEKSRELLPFWEKHAEKNDVFALENLFEYYKGDIFWGAGEPFAKEHIRYLKKAKENGSIKSCMEIAGLYQKGALGFPYDIEKAFECWNKVYEAECSESRWALNQLVEISVNSIPGAWNYLSDIESKISKTKIFFLIEKNYDLDAKKAFGFLKKCADGESTDSYLKTISRYAVSFCCHEGIGTEKNEILATEYDYVQCPKSELKKANDYQTDVLWLAKVKKMAEKNDSVALCALGKYFMEKYDGQEFNPLIPQEDFIGYLEKSASFGYPNAFYYLGSAYMKGYGKNKDDFKKTVPTLLKGAALGNKMCSLTLSDIYAKGIIVPFSKDLALYFSFLNFNNETSETQMLLDGEDYKAATDSYMKNFGAADKVPEIYGMEIVEEDIKTKDDEKNTLNSDTKGNKDISANENTVDENAGANASEIENTANEIAFNETPGIMKKYRTLESIRNMMKEEEKAKSEKKNEKTELDFQKNEVQEDTLETDGISDECEVLYDTSMYSENTENAEPANSFEYDFFYDENDEKRGLAEKALKRSIFYTFEDGENPDDALGKPTVITNENHLYYYNENAASFSTMEEAISCCFSRITTKLFLNSDDSILECFYDAKCFDKTAATSCFLEMCTFSDMITKTDKFKIKFYPKFMHESLYAKEFYFTPFYIMTEKDGIEFISEVNEILVHHDLSSNTYKVVYVPNVLEQKK